MRIGVLTTSFPDHAAGDALSGHFVEAHCQALLQQGHCVEVVAVRRGPAAGRTAAMPVGGIFPRVRWLPGGELFAAGGAPEAWERARGLRAQVQSVLSAGRIVAGQARAAWRGRAQWDATVAHWLVPSAIAALPSRGPLLAIAHGGDVHMLLQSRLAAAAAWALRARQARLVFVAASGLAAIRDALPGALAAWLDANSIVMPMGVDTARFAAVARAAPLRSSAGPLRILFVGRVEPIKGIDVLLRAVALLPSKIALRVVGAGAALGEMRALTQALGLCTRHDVDFVGAVSPSVRDQHLQWADVVVVPSRQLRNGRTEGTPQIALEALASGRAVVASATGGLCDLPAPAVLVPPNQPVALASAIARVLEHRPSRAACQAAVATYDWRDVAHTINDFWLR